MTFANYNGKTLAQVRNILIKRGIKPAQRHEFIDQLKQWRKEQKSHAAVHRHYRNVWRVFAKPLVHELRKVQVALYYKGSPHRSNALLNYRELLEELLNLFKGFAEGRRSPKEIATHNRLPNDGAHWTDWIPADEKERINEIFTLAREKGRKMYQAFPKEDRGQMSR